MTTFYTGPNAEARANFVEYLARFLKNPENAAKHADIALAEHDWSASLNIEVRGFYAKDGNPITFAFADSDMISEEIEE